MPLRMGRSGKALLTGLGLICVTIPLQPAEAQWIGFHHHQYYAPPVIEPDELSPRELVHAARSQGFNQATRPVYHDEVAVMTAIDREGRRVRLTLDIYSGQIVNLSPLGRAQVARPRARDVVRHPVEREEAAPRRERPQVVQRVPDQGASIKRSVPENDKRARATPEKPTIIRREPLLPPQPGQSGAGSKSDRAKPALTPPAQAQKPADPVGSGTREAPRRIDIAPQSGTSTPPPPPPALPAPDPSATPPI